jgi:hypothetical protein
MKDLEICKNENLYEIKFNFFKKGSSKVNASFDNMEKITNACSVAQEEEIILDTKNLEVKHCKNKIAFRRLPETGICIGYIHVKKEEFLEALSKV